MKAILTIAMLTAFFVSACNTTGVPTEFANACAQDLDGKTIEVSGVLEPRTMVLAPDGRSLYVVDYLAGRLVKIGTSSMRVLQSVPLGYHPIGVTYDAGTSHVWVAGYGGSIWVLRDLARSTSDRRAS